jgi:hypothetical protein
MKGLLLVIGTPKTPHAPQVWPSSSAPSTPSALCAQCRHTSWLSFLSAAKCMTPLVDAEAKARGRTKREPLPPRLTLLLAFSVPSVVHRSRSGVSCTGAGLGRGQLLSTPGLVEPMGDDMYGGSTSPYVLQGARGGDENETVDGMRGNESAAFAACPAKFSPASLTSSG